MDHKYDNLYYSNLYSSDRKKEEEYRRTYEKLGYRYDDKDKKENKEESLDAK